MKFFEHLSMFPLYEERGQIIIMDCIKSFECKTPENIRQSKKSIMFS